MAGGMWIKGAIKRPGALRATAKRMGMISGEEPLSAADLGRLAKSKSPTTRRRAALARTLGRLRSGG